jgi:hypothetical protein
MNVVVAPAALSFAPRPYAAELLSSWLLRVAAANQVSLRELLEGFEERYGQVLTNSPIDYAIPEAGVAALSQFCRVAPEKIRALDLHERRTHLSPALLLRYHDNLSLLWCPRCSLRRVRYAFCPLCLANQRAIHIRWDWSVACLIRCAIHRVPLLDNCPTCGELDPITFSAFDTSAPRVCRSCGKDLTTGQNETANVRHTHDIQAVEHAYRDMLLGLAPQPTLLGKATDRAFRQFVEDMLQLLSRNLNPCSRWQTNSALPFSERDLFQIITALIENATPSSDPRVRRRHYSRGLSLWATLLKVIPKYEGSAIEQSSRRWPPSLRRRFASALYYRTKERWPYSPYGTNLDRRIEHREIAAIYGLRASTAAQIPVPPKFSHKFVSHLATSRP